MRTGVVDDAVKPGEIVFPLFGFAFRPSALKSYGLDAEWCKKCLVLLEVREVSVKRLATNRPVGISDLGD